MKRLKSINKGTIGLYLEVFMLIFISVTPLINQEIKSVVLLFDFLINIKYLFTKSSKRNTYFLILFIIFCLIIVYLDLMFSKSILGIQLLSLYIPLVFINSYTIANKYSFREFILAFEKIIFFTAIFSVVGVFIYTFAPQIVPRLITYTNKHTTHKTAIFFNILVSEGLPLKRNSGIAWEPGVYQLLINIALYTYYFIKNEKKSVFVVIFYAFIILTTLSTVGLLILGIIFVRIMIDNKKIMTVSLYGLAFFSPVLYEVIEYQIRNKLVGSSSFSQRFIPFMNGMNVMFKYPFGLGNFKFIEYFEVILPPWDAIAQMVARYGVYFLIFYLAAFIINNEKRLGLIVIFVLTFFSQNIWLFPMTIPFIFLNNQKLTKTSTKLDVQQDSNLSNHKIQEVAS